MATVRERALDILKKIPVPIRSTDPGGLYAKYTGGLTHQTLADNWKKGGIMTGCNAFAGWYANELASKLYLGRSDPKLYLGRFDLATYLPSHGKGHAWIKSEEGKAPLPGDILIHTGLHEDVCVGFEGKVLVRIAGGQGGKGMGCDLISRVPGPGKAAEYSAGKLQGWVDIELYFKETVASPLEQWLQGWWSVWDGKQYYYYFGQGGYVQYTKTKPVNKAAPPKSALNSGKVTISIAGAVVLDWNPADGGATRETFSNARIGGTQMNGTSNRYAPLVATRMA